MLLSACGQAPATPEKAAAAPKEAPVKATNATLDSIDTANNNSIAASGNEVTRAYVSAQDSSISLTANMRRDHRIFGYAAPDLTSERLLLLSIYTNDVENNPFRCKLGAYYDTAEMEGMQLKYAGTTGDFVKARVTDKAGKATTVYFEKKWVERE